MKPKRLPEGYFRLYRILPYIPSIFLFVIALCGIFIEEWNWGEDKVIGATTYIIAAIVAFFITYYFLTGVTLIVIWIIEGFREQ
jgi:hypothetical protein